MAETTKGVEIKVSRSTYQAVRDALLKAGKKLESDGRNIPVIIEPDDKLVDPIDWQLAKVRNDACGFASTIFNSIGEEGETGSVEEYVTAANVIADFILKGTIKKEEEETKKPEGWK